MGNAELVRKIDSNQIGTNYAYTYNTYTSAHTIMRLFRAWFGADITFYWINTTSLSRRAHAAR